MKIIKIVSFIDRPNKFTGRAITPHGSIATFKNGLYHSYNDKPSYENNQGSQFWHKNGIHHRSNGKPAIIYPVNTNRNKHKEYWINGKKVSKEAAQVYAMLFLNKI